MKKRFQWKQLLAAVLLGIVPFVFRIFDRVFQTYDRLNNVVQENVHPSFFLRLYGKASLLSIFLLVNLPK